MVEAVTPVRSIRPPLLLMPMFAFTRVERTVGAPSVKFTPSEFVPSRMSESSSMPPVNTTPMRLFVCNAAASTTLIRRAVPFVHSPRRPATAVRRQLDLTSWIDVPGPPIRRSTRSLPRPGS